ncbi:MAG: hypothetical protein OD815_000061 [Candidatus Alkanophagales archaeon MCA70_species_2]|nr:hypothetical protein [Candidatus Alkanophaga liquidiphilum]
MIALERFDIKPKRGVLGRIYVRMVSASRTPSAAVSVRRKVCGEGRFSSAAAADAPTMPTLMQRVNPPSGERP